MTKRELSQLYYLNREIQQEQKKLRELREAATDTSVHISGLPHGSGISDKTAIAVAIAESQTIIDAKTKMITVEYNRINRFIADIQDSQMRIMIAARFRDCKTWTAVAMAAGGNNTASGCRMAVERFLQNQ